MFDEPYLETCCRSALHRLTLCGAPGRPSGLKDGMCLERLACEGFAAEHDGRYHVTPQGQSRHSAEILKRVRPVRAPAAAAGRATAMR